MKRIKGCFLTLTALLAAGSLGAAAKGNESLEVIPYGWYAGLRGDMTINGNKTHFVQEASDLFEDLDIGGSLAIVAHNNKMVILGSIDYFDLISSDVEVGNQTGTLETTEIIGLLAVGYPLSSNRRSSVDALMGMQILSMENDLKLSGGGSTSSDTKAYDPIFILRIRQQLTDRLQLCVPLGIGGYLGDSDLLYNADLQLVIQISDRFNVRGGYRVVGYNFEANSANELDFYQAGWTLGLGIIF